MLLFYVVTFYLSAKINKNSGDNNNRLDTVKAVCGNSKNSIKSFIFLILIYCSNLSIIIMTYLITFLKCFIKIY